MRSYIWRFLCSPRRVFGAISALAFLIAVGMAIYAYTDRPRLEVVPLDETLLNVLSQPYSVTITGDSTFIYGTWECRDKDGKARYDAEALCSRLRSPDFLESYAAAAIAHHHRLSELFSGTDGGLVCRHYRNEEAYSRNVLCIRAMFSRRFAVRSPTYSWSKWMQHRLPFMPDRTALIRIANERNRQATDVLDSQIRKAFPDLESQTTSDS